MTLFSDQLKQTGKVAEAQAERLLKQLNGIVIDVSEDSQWKAKDIDFIVTFSNSKMFYVEVKSDKHISNTKNFNFEAVRFYHKTGEQRMGWTHFSMAEYFFVWDTVDHMYIFDAVEVRKAKDNLIKTNRHDTKTRIVYSDNDTSTLNVLIPLSTILKRTVWYVNNGVWIKAQS